MGGESIRASSTWTLTYANSAVEHHAKMVYTVPELMRQVYTSTTDLGSLTNLFNKPPHNADFSLISAELAYIPSDPLEVSEDGAGIPETKAESIMSLVEALEDDGDVVKVWTNLA